MNVLWIELDCGSCRQAGRKWELAYALRWLAGDQSRARKMSITIRCHFSWLSTSHKSHRTTVCPWFSPGSSSDRASRATHSVSGMHFRWFSSLRKLELVSTDDRRRGRQLIPYQWLNRMSLCHSATVLPSSWWLSKRILSHRLKLGPYLAFTQARCW